MKKTGAIGVLLKSLLSGKAPFTIRRGENGQLQCTCPKCQQNVVVTPGAAGEVAFQCPHCGERANWQSDASRFGSQLPTNVPPRNQTQSTLVTMVLAAILLGAFYLGVPRGLAIALVAAAIIAWGVAGALRHRRRRNV